MATWLLCLLFAAVSASPWAVLAAGSSGYWNYRHQADLCHSYQLLLAQGVSADHIIALSYNDVANSTENPFPEHLYSVPGESPPDVFTGCVIDYQGHENNSTTFLAVLTGNKTVVEGLGSERVLESSSTDDVFVYFVDHGAPGLVAFPNDILYADELAAALQEMSGKGLFNRLVFFLEACYGGSMFDGFLESDGGIYAMTAANDTESSWGVYCPVYDDIVDGEKMYTCLADMFSAHWMDVASSSDLTQTSISEMYTAVSSLTNLSHVMEYGDLSVAGASAGDFLGLIQSENPHSPQEFTVVSPWWTSYDAKYQYFAYKYLTYPSPENAQALLDEVSDRMEVTNIFSKVMLALSPDDPLHLETDSRPVQNYDCLRASVNSFRAICHQITEFTLRYIPVLKNACEEEFSVKEISNSLKTVCGSVREKTDVRKEHLLRYLKESETELDAKLLEELLDSRLE